MLRGNEGTYSARLVTRDSRVVVALILDTRASRGSAASAVEKVGTPQTKARTERKKRPNNTGADERC